jgi:hypothetical protein
LHRTASFLLLFCFLGLGSGVIEYAHNLQHAAEDAIEDAKARAAGLPPESHHHDESNCHVHAQLHLGCLPAGWLPVLIALGLWISFLTLLSEPLIPRAVPVRIDCRGPPGF